MGIIAESSGGPGKPTMEGAFPAQTQEPGHFLPWDYIILEGNFKQLH